MSKENKCDYSKKHSSGSIDPLIEAALKAKSVNNRVSCLHAHEIALKMNISPMKVGTNMDLLNLRIEKCQLGLFGYTPNKRIVKPIENMDQDLEKAIVSAEEEGKLPCIAAFIISEKMEIPKLKVAGAAEKMNKRVSNCQLGAF